MRVFILHLKPSVFNIEYKVLIHIGSYIKILLCNSVLTERIFKNISLIFVLSIEVSSDSSDCFSLLIIFSDNSLFVLLIIYNNNYKTYINL